MRVERVVRSSHRAVYQTLEGVGRHQADRQEPLTEGLTRAVKCRVRGEAVVMSAPLAHVDRPRW